MEIVVFWLGFTVVVGVLAARKQRSVFGWVVLSLVISPLIAGLLLLVLPSNASADGDSTTTRCPYCRELVRRDAVKCKHCGSSIGTEAAQA